MSENNFIKFANSFQAIARLELKSITLLLDFLGHPERDLQFIHVAGTNGKGSVCAYLAEIFKAAGKKVGKYTSPNMLSVCERIWVDGKDIPMPDLERILKKVEVAAKKVTKQSGDSPTQFEIWTAAAFVFFKEQECDLVVLETGLGGMQDATNVIPPPLASVITRIDIDHTSYLGNTLFEIALQKAGIIKKHPNNKQGITFLAQQEEEAYLALINNAKEKNNIVIMPQKCNIHSPEGIYEVIDYAEYKGLKIGIGGYHQIENACLAIEVAKHFGLSEDAIRNGLLNSKNIGRFEAIFPDASLLFDGAHNPNGMRALAKSLKRYFPNKKINFVIGFMADKDILSAIAELRKEYPDFECFTVTVKDNPRAINAEELSRLLTNENIFSTPCENIKIACEKARKNACLTVICGSLYLYKDFMDSGVKNILK